MGNLILDSYVDSGLNPTEYLDSIAVHNNGKRAVWDSFGFRWRATGEVKGYEVERGYIVSAEHYETLMNLLTMVKVLNGELKVDKEKFMQEYPKFEYMMQTKERYVEVQDKSWQDKEELIVFGNEPSQDFKLKGKIVHTNCEELLDRFNCDETEIRGLTFYTTNTQEFYTRLLQKNNLDEKYNIAEGTPKGKPTVVFVSEETKYLRYQMQALSEQGTETYLVQKGADLIE